MIMQTAIFNTKSKDDIQLLVRLAKKLGIQTKLLTAEEKEELGLAHAMKIGRTGEYVDTDSFLKNFRG